MTLQAGGFAQEFKLVPKLVKIGDDFQEVEGVSQLAVIMEVPTEQNERYIIATPLQSKTRFSQKRSVFSED